MSFQVDFVTQLRESDGKISLGGRDVENAGAGRKHFSDGEKVARRRRS